MDSAKTPSMLISAAELDELKTGNPSSVVLIDTREPNAYADGHIAGAVNMHDIFTYLATSTQTGNNAMKNKFAQLFGKAGLGGEETAVIYEEEMDTGFGQSCRGWAILRYLGYPEEKTRVLDGGIAAWTALGKPVATSDRLSTPRSPISATPKTFPVSDAGESLLVNVAEMRQIVEDQSRGRGAPVVLLDTRDAEEWNCLSSSPYGVDFCPRKGRIPGAVWIEWREMMEKTPAGARIKGPEGVMKECAKVGIDYDTPVIVYCFKGARASNTLIALLGAGVKNVRMYMGSWNEWSRDESLPIVSGTRQVSVSSGTRDKSLGLVTETTEVTVSEGN
ncbi:Putative thiosulfate sulfurtransferase [Cytospora mali]|uniref:Thiosulfate sulfurtransferase n=1 Tax=Cytospora mali TaxID=578113 RepID=A0A194WDM5_CYTMA|nr:Putative thiosulfate sulfurtransferase [Valsa mali]